MSYQPAYGTSYGSDYGYNVRASNNNAAFRNRYENTSFNPSMTAPARPATLPPLNSTASSMNMTGPQPGWGNQFDNSMSRTAPYNQPTGPVPLSGPPYVPSTSLRLNEPLPDNMSSGRPCGPVIPKKPVVYPPQQPDTVAVRNARYPMVPQHAKDPKICRPGLTEVKLDGKSNFGKLSLSRRLDERERLRYHIPGYMGFVRNQHFLHGDTFGKTTRLCVMSQPLPR